VKKLSVDNLIAKAGGVIPLARLLGVARTTVYDWKRTGIIPGTRVAQISRALSVPAAELLPIVQQPRSKAAA